MQRYSLDSEKSQLDRLREEVLRFRDERDWGQFHNAKDLALGLSVEASELLAEFLWKSSENANRNAVVEELADVLIFSILLSDKLGIDLDHAVRKKLESNAEKYPVEKARGSALKYTEL